MSLAPEVATSPLAEAPPDRPTTDLEQWARTGIALLFGDRVLDQNEQRILRGFMEEVALRAQAGGGIGMGGTPPADHPQQSPMEMNAAGAEDYGDGQGEPTGETY